MTILSKADASTNDGSDYYTDADAKQPASPTSPTSPTSKPLPRSPLDPPTYEETVVRGSSTSSGVPAQISSGSSQAVALPAPTNHYYIDKFNGAIYGTYNINTDLALPASLLGPAGEEHLHLHTFNGAIKAKLLLTSGSSIPALCSLSTKNGAISFRMLSRLGDQPIQVKMKSWNGSITVGLPRGFNGPLSHTTRNGSIKFSPGVKEHVRLLRGDQSFMGDWTNHPQDVKNAESWPGDQITAETLNGSIRFAFEDELEYEEQNGFFANVKKLFSF